MAKASHSRGGAPRGGFIQSDLRKRIDESFVQFYFLLLGISQNVILGLFLARLSHYDFFSHNLSFALLVSDKFWGNLVTRAEQYDRWWCPGCV